MRILTFLVFLGLGFIHPVLAQCSNGTVTFRSYSSIKYGKLASTLRLEYDVKATIIVPGGPPGGQLRLVNLTVLRKDGSEASKPNSNRFARLCSLNL